MNGFDYFASEMDTDFLRYIFGQIRAVAEEYGLDCLAVTLGKSWSDLGVTLGCQGSNVGMLCFLDGRWGYSFDREEMYPTPTPERAAYCLMLEHTENCGVIGDIAA